MFELTDCTLVLGRRGSGKSHLGKVVQSVYPRKIVLDPMDEYPSEGAVFGFEEFSNKILEFKLNRISEFNLIIKFNPENENLENEFNEIMRILFIFGNCLIVIEEIQLFSHPHFIPHWLKQCLLLGRHRGIGLLFTTQRPGELHKTVLSQCAHIFAGQIFERNDINYISGFLGINAQKLINLKPREFIYFSPGKSILLVDNDLKNSRELI